MSDHESTFELGVVDTTLRTEPRSCPLCGSAQGVPTSSDNTMIRCAQCEIVYRSRIYVGESDYWAKYIDCEIEKNYDTNRREYYMEFWQWLKRYAKGRQNPSAKPRMLDVGCSPGNILLCAAKDGWEIHGAETSRELCELTKDYCGAKTWEGFIEEIDFGEYQFEMITFSDVFRCVTNPVDALKKCNELLAPGGVLVIREIDASSNKHRKRLESPYPFDMQFLSGETAKRFLSETGFAPIVIDNSPMSLLTNRKIYWLARNYRWCYRIALKTANTIARATNPIARFRGRPITTSFHAVGYKKR